MSKGKLPVGCTNHHHIGKAQERVDITDNLWAIYGVFQHLTIRHGDIWATYKDVMAKLREESKTMERG
eukprot:scaffold25313_cov16-Prasinocladus_malaysianus.AAC.1